MQILALFSSLPVALAFSNPICYFTPCAHTTSGLVAGHTAVNQHSVTEYLGIPFAQPPIGHLRFAPPQPYIGTGFINGTDFGFSCPKLLNDSYSLNPQRFPDVIGNFTPAGVQFLDVVSQYGAEYREREDCLTLNIWTKHGRSTRDSKGRGKAVMVWIYGGGFQFGSTAAEIYNGARIADEEDIIVVSLNYRVDIFGFPGALDPKNPVKNLGLLDQRLALEWVRDNIEAFGGDPERITLAGQSAGAISVDYHSYSYSHDPIASAMILQSGTAQSASTDTTPTTNSSSPLEIWIDIATKLNCTSPSDTPSLSLSSASASAILNCMRSPSLTTSAILSIAHLYPTSFTPIIDNITVFPHSLYSSLTPAHIPLLIGTSDNEGEIFAARALMTDFPLNDTAKAALTNASFTCPAAVRARVSASMGAKTWRYRYFGDFKELRLLRPEVGGRESSAYHVSDVYMVFGNWAMGKWNPRVTGEQERLGRYMRGAWGAFVREPERGLGAYGGVDRDGESGVRELRSEGNGQRVMKVEDGDEIVNGEGGGWPVYEEGRKTLVRLGWKNRVGANLGWPGTYDDYCSQ